MTKYLLQVTDFRLTEDVNGDQVVSIGIFDDKDKA